MSDSTFDVALEKRFTDSTAAVAVTSLDTLLVYDVETGVIFKLPVSVLTNAINAAAPVQSVAGKTGNVTLNKSDVGLSNVDNTSDATKNSATATLENKTLSSPVISGIADVSGGRLKFPAVQVPSADPNTLDDYEEGSFTPSLSCSVSNPAVTYSLQRGEYLKIGKFVQCSIYLSWSAISGGSGNIRVNLPFDIDSSIGTSPGGVITRMRGLTIPSSRVWSQIEGIHGSNFVQITGMLTGSSTVILDASAFTAQIGELCFNISYRAAA